MRIIIPQTAGACQGLLHQIGKQDEIGGVGAAVFVQVSGEDLDLLGQLGAEQELLHEPQIHAVDRAAAVDVAGDDQRVLCGRCYCDPPGADFAGGLCHGSGTDLDFFSGHRVAQRGGCSTGRDVQIAILDADAGDRRWCGRSSG